MNGYDQHVQRLCQTCRMPLRQGETCQLHGRISRDDLSQITRFAWTLQLETKGFNQPERERLIFLKWRRMHGRLTRV